MASCRTKHFLCAAAATAGGGGAPAYSSRGCHGHGRRRRRLLLFCQGDLVIQLAPPRGVLGSLGGAALAPEPPLAGLAAPAAEGARGAAVAGPLHLRAVVAALAEEKRGLRLRLGLRFFVRAILLKVSVERVCMNVSCADSKGALYVQLYALDTYRDPLRMPLTHAKENAPPPESPAAGAALLFVSFVLEPLRTPRGDRFLPRGVHVHQPVL